MMGKMIDIYREISAIFGIIACNITLLGFCIAVYKIFRSRVVKVVIYGDSLNAPGTYYGMSVAKRLEDAGWNVTNRSLGGVVSSYPLFGANSAWNWTNLPDTTSSHSRVVIMLGANDMAGDVNKTFNNIFRGIFDHIVGSSIGIGSWFRRPSSDYMNMVNIAYSPSNALRYDLATLRPSEPFSFQVICNKRYIIIGIYPYDGAMTVMDVIINGDLYYVQDAAIQQQGYYSSLVIIDSGSSGNKVVTISGKAVNNVAYTHFTTVNSVDSFPIPVDVVCTCILSNSHLDCKNNANYRAAIQAAVICAKSYGINARLIDVPGSPFLTPDSVHGNRPAYNRIAKEILSS